MRTFEQQLQEAVGASYPLDIILANLSADETLEEVNIFAKEVAKEALKNASRVGDALRENGDLVKQIITNESNIPEL